MPASSVLTAMPNAHPYLSFEARSLSWSSDSQWKVLIKVTLWNCKRRAICAWAGWDPASASFVYRWFWQAAWFGAHSWRAELLSLLCVSSLGILFNADSDSSLWAGHRWCLLLVVMTSLWIDYQKPILWDWPAPDGTFVPNTPLLYWFSSTAIMMYHTLLPFPFGFWVVFLNVMPVTEVLYSWRLWPSWSPEHSAPTLRRWELLGSTGYVFFPSWNQFQSQPCETLESEQA